jgi:hypothetical protein
MAETTTRPRVFAAALEVAEIDGGFCYGLRRSSMQLELLRR